MMNLRDQLIRDEGKRYIPYKDSRGFWTVGVGHKLSGPPASLEPVTDRQINIWLDDDIKSVTDSLSSFAWFQSLDTVRQGVFQNMAFNLGVSGLLHFVHVIAAAVEEDWSTTVMEMKESLWAKEVGIRADRLMEQMMTGGWV